MTPVPYRGKRNLSVYIENVINKIAEIKNVTPEEVAEITTKNARFFYGI